MKKKIVMIAVIIVLIGAFIRLFSPQLGFRLGDFGVTLRFIGDIIGLIGVILIIYGLISKNP